MTPTLGHSYKIHIHMQNMPPKIPRDLKCINREEIKHKISALLDDQRGSKDSELKDVIK